MRPLPARLRPAGARKYPTDLVLYLALPFPCPIMTVGSTCSMILALAVFRSSPLTFHVSSSPTALYQQQVVAPSPGVLSSLRLGTVTSSSVPYTSTPPPARAGRQPKLAAATPSLRAGTVSLDSVPSSTSIQARLERIAYDRAFADAAHKYTADALANRALIVGLEEQVSSLRARLDAAIAAQQQAESERDAAVGSTASKVREAKAAAIKAAASQLLEASNAVSQRTIDRHVNAALAASKQQTDAQMRKAEADAESARTLAAEQCRRAEGQLTEQQLASTAAMEVLVKQIDALTKSAGHYKKQAADLLTAERKRRESEGSAATVRQKEALRIKELAAARTNDAQLRTENERLRPFEEAQVASGCRARPAVGSLTEDAQVAPPMTQMTLIAPRISRSRDAPLTARSCEYLRRLCEEVGGSFKGVSAAIALVLNMLK